ncbi:MAG: SPOR domain-containing protein [Bacteroidales bacterium]|nr:SPOR domain-containing protein [Bacteroidales bacterium]
MQIKRFLIITLLASIYLIVPESTQGQNYREQMKLIRLKPNNVMVFGVINDYTGEKLSGASISLFDPSILITTETIPVDDMGEYLFTIEKGKKIGFLVEKEGYFPYYHELTISLDAEDEYEYKLHLPDGIRKTYSLIYTSDGTIPSNNDLLEELISLLINQTGLSIWMPVQENPLGKSRITFLDSLFLSRGIEDYRLISGSLPGDTDQIVELNFMTDTEAKETDASVFEGKSMVSDKDDKWTLQFSASRSELSVKGLKNLKDTRMFKGKDGYYRYTYGVFNSRQEANQAISFLHDKGFSQAFPKLIGNLKKL